MVAETVVPPVKCLEQATAISLFDIFIASLLEESLSIFTLSTPAQIQRLDDSNVKLLQSTVDHNSNIIFTGWQVFTTTAFSIALSFKFIIYFAMFVNKKSFILPIFFI